MVTTEQLKLLERIIIIVLLNVLALVYDDYALSVAIMIDGMLLGYGANVLVGKVQNGKKEIKKQVEGKK